ncbi:hypothetical protein FOCC_FOCC017272 [Frankliniella occidentalis]|nr:hypothetical protein FOCC_FOCC017272 [Frankliniella occidentalis]
MLRLDGRRGALPRGPGCSRRLRRPRHRHGAGRVREPVGVHRALVLLRLLQVVQPVRPVRVARAVRLVDRQRRVPAVGRRHAPGGQPQPHQRPGRDVLRVPGSRECVPTRDGRRLYSRT